ncbi:hypothetical protein DXG01_009599, partial [Tephrocybe rancida]
MDVRNAFFNQVGLRFGVPRINRTAVSNSFLHGAAMNNDAEASIKQWREGNVQTLNIYTVGTNPLAGSLGGAPSHGITTRSHRMTVLTWSTITYLKAIPVATIPERMVVKEVTMWMILLPKPVPLPDAPPAQTLAQLKVLTQS